MARQRDRRRRISLAVFPLLVTAFLFVSLPAFAANEDAQGQDPETVEPGPVDVGIEEPIVPSNDLSNGGELYRSECAACHAATGIGGALSFLNNAPPLKGYTALEIAAAMRGGPGEMPFFGPDTINDEELQQIVTYTLFLRAPDDRGGAPIARVGPVMEGLVTLGAAMSAIILGLMWIGERRA